MLDLLLSYRTPIATVFGSVSGLAVLIYSPLAWYFSLPLALLAVVAAAALWGVFLGFLELPRNRL
jgi:ABC-type uncharacterized transport system permease subunit